MKPAHAASTASVTAARPVRSWQSRVLRWAVLAALLPFSVSASPATAPSNTSAGPSQASLNSQLQETLTHAELVGHFTAEGDAGTPKADRYVIESARPLSGDLWVLSARLQFGTHDATLPLVVPIKWAGDTPVISVTDMSVPGIGTYTARVVIYRDHYAGTWSGAKHGGAMWGEIHHLPTTQPTTQPGSLLPAE